MEQAYYYRHFARRNTAENRPKSRSSDQSSHVSYRLVATCQQAVQHGVVFLGTASKGGHRFSVLLPKVLAKAR